MQYGPTLVGDQLVEEFMTETQQAATAAPQAFRMDSLLQVRKEGGRMRCLSHWNKAEWGWKGYNSLRFKRIEKLAKFREEELI